MLSLVQELFTQPAVVVAVTIRLMHFHQVQVVQKTIQATVVDRQAAEQYKQQPEEPIEAAEAEALVILHQIPQDQAGQA